MREMILGGGRMIKGWEHKRRVRGSGVYAKEFFFYFFFLRKRERKGGIQIKKFFLTHTRGIENGRQS